MTSSTLYREGDDLDALLAELSAEYDGRVRVVTVDEGRIGGVGGFFARRRVGVHFTVAEAQSSNAADPLAELIDRAEAAEAAGPSTAATTVGSNAEFAAMLLELAAAKAAGRSEPEVASRPALAVAHRPAPRPAPRSARPVELPDFSARVEPSAPELPEAPSAPVAIIEPDARPAVTHDASDAALVLRRRLADIGVPMHLLPATASDPVAAVRTIVAALPGTPEPPAGRGTILAVVGPAAQARAAAERIARESDVPAERIWWAGQPTDAIAGALSISDAWDAATAARATRERVDRTVVAVVATDVDPGGSRNRQPARILAALGADAVWAIVDATRKTSDTRRRLAELGPVTAAVVVDAAETDSPATVLELGVPVALLDGEPASAQRWTAALLDALGPQER